MHDGHQRAGDAGGIGVLDDIASIDNPRGALSDQRHRTSKQFLLGRFAAAAYEHRNATGSFNDLVINGNIVGGIGLNNVGAQLDGLSHERDDFFRIAVDHVAARARIGLKHQRLDHQRHTVVVTLRL